MSSKKNSFFSWLTRKSVNKENIKKEHNSLIVQDNQDQPIIEKKNLSEVQRNSLIKNSKEILNIEKQSLKKDILINSDTIKKDISIFKENIPVENSFFLKLNNSLKKTKEFFSNISKIFVRKKIDHSFFELLEEQMLLADIGIDTTNLIINNLIKTAHDQKLCTSDQLYKLLQSHMYLMLRKVEVPLIIEKKIPFIILVVGVNGTGKTTTVMKLAKKYQLEGKSVIVAAGDTFRAAGIEQLQILGQLNKIPIISSPYSLDPAAVVFDAVKSAIAKKIDVLIIDTAGRLHNKLYLMEELKKIIRVIKKIDISAPHEIILIIDACNGQNTIKQMQNFHNSLHVTGIILTKLDGTAKGGIVFTLANHFLIPIRYIGIGERITDLGIFNSQDFIRSIFNKK